MSAPCSPRSLPPTTGSTASSASAWISAGGGLPIPYREDQSYVDLDRYFELWDASRNRLQEELGHPLKLEIEPGRYIAAESGYLVTEIRAIKKPEPYKAKGIRYEGEYVRRKGGKAAKAGA